MKNTRAILAAAMAVLAVVAVVCMLSGSTESIAAEVSRDVELAPGVKQNIKFFHDPAFFSKDGHKPLNDDLFAPDNDDVADDIDAVEHGSTRSELLPKSVRKDLTAMPSSGTPKKESEGTEWMHPGGKPYTKDTYLASGEETHQEKEVAVETRDHIARKPNVQDKITKKEIQEMKDIPNSLPEGQQFKDTAFGDLPDPVFTHPVRADTMFSKPAVEQDTKWDDMKIGEIIKEADKAVKKKSKPAEYKVFSDAFAGTETEK